MSEAVELYRKNEDAKMVPSGVFYCSECCSVFANEDRAKECHGERICSCGNRIEHYYSQCQECTNKRFLAEQKDEEKKRFAEAKKINAAEYSGGKVFCGDKYYDSAEDVVNDYPVPPAYVWACTDRGVPQATTQWITENIIDEMWEDADESDLNGMEELQLAIAAFNEANKSVSVWEPDYGTAILTGMA